MTQINQTSVSAVEHGCINPAEYLKNEFGAVVTVWPTGVASCVDEKGIIHIARPIANRAGFS
jgi:hypothetical protein